jgi:hypothetical protein
MFSFLPMHGIGSAGKWQLAGNGRVVVQVSLNVGSTVPSISHICFAKSGRFRELGF